MGAPPVKGAYHFNSDSAFTPADAVAFRREDGEGRRVVVLLLGSTANLPPLSGVLDVEAAAEARKTAAGSWMELIYRENGEWVKTNYTFNRGPASGAGSSYSREQAPMMKVAIRSGRVTGRLLVTSRAGQRLDFTLDVPIEDSAAGKPLPADGGEPAKSLRACHAAYAAKKEADLASACSRRLNEVVTSALRMRAERIDVPDPWTPDGVDTCSAEAIARLEILGGVTAGDEARLAARGKILREGQERICRGHVFLRREEGAWRVSASRMDYVPE